MFDNYKGYEIKQIEAWANGVGYEVAHWNAALSVKKEKKVLWKEFRKTATLF